MFAIIPLLGILSRILFFHKFLSRNFSCKSTCMQIPKDNICLKQLFNSGFTGVTEICAPLNYCFILRPQSENKWLIKTSSLGEFYILLHLSAVGSKSLQLSRVNSGARGEQDDASNQLLHCSAGRGEEAAIFYSIHLQEIWQHTGYCYTWCLCACPSLSCNLEIAV